jgi:hypothetical protein
MLFQNRMLKRIFEPKWDEVTGEWRKFHHEKLSGLCPPTIVRVIKSRKMRWAWHVAHIVSGEACTGF